MACPEHAPTFGSAKMACLGLEKVIGGRLSLGVVSKAIPGNRGCEANTFI